MRIVDFDAESHADSISFTDSFGYVDISSSIYDMQIAIDDAIVIRHRGHELFRGIVTLVEIGSDLLISATCDVFIKEDQAAEDQAELVAGLPHHNYISPLSLPG